MPLRDLDVMLNAKTTKTSRRTITKIAILGDSGVGKTSLIERFVNSGFSEKYNMTIGGNFYTKKIPLANGKLQMTIISDVSGQARFQDVRQVFYNGVDIALAVCDLTRKDSLQNIEKIWIPEFLSWVSRPGFKPKIQLVGNKVDLRDLLVISKRDLEEMVSRLTIKYPHTTILKPILITSAKKNTFIEHSSSKTKKAVPGYA